MGNFELISFGTDEALASAVALQWVEVLSGRTDPGLFYVALSGGRVARKFFIAAGEHIGQRSVPISQVHFFWADERCVPPTDPESNFALARRYLLDRLSIQPDRIHRLRGEISPEQAAAEAEAEICRIAPPNREGLPVLDLVLLGMGEDGHVASLFPGVAERVLGVSSVYLPVVGPKPPPNRLTMTFVALAAAKQVWVLASGSGKERALKESLSPDGKTPLARLLRLRSNTLIFSDVRVSEKSF